jgi:hypothetical protein
MTDASNRSIGISPHTSGTYQGLNYSAASGSLTINRQESANIRTNRVVQDQVQTSYQAGMTISLDLYYDNTTNNALPLLLESLFRMPRESVAAAAFTGGYTTTTLAASSTGDIQVGDIVKLTDANNLVAFRRVTEVVTNTSVKINAAFASATAAVSPNHRLYVNSFAQPLDILIKDLVSGTSQEELFTAMEVDSARLRIADQDRTTLELTLLGEDSDGGRQPSTPTTIGDSPIAEVFNTKGHVKTTMLDNSEAEGLDFEIGLSNSLRQRTVVGQLPAISVGAGTARVSGSWSQYFENFTEYQKAIQDTSSALVIGHQTAEGAYAWSVPRIKYSDQSREHSGQDTDIIIRLPFEGLGADSLTDSQQSSLRLCFFDA